MLKSIFLDVIEITLNTTAVVGIPVKMCTNTIKKVTNKVKSEIDEYISVKSFKTTYVNNIFDK